jgi:hypothetical protein
MDISMNKLTISGVALCIVSFSLPVSAAPLVASATATVRPDGSDFDYSIALTNTSSSTVGLGTFWFAWVPGQDFLPSNPISETSPNGWAVNLISHEGSSDGFAIQWVSTSPASDLGPGKSLVFGFKSPDPPAALSGTSQFFQGTPIGTSFVYQGGPFVGASDQFLVTVPTAAPSASTVSTATASTPTSASANSSMTTASIATDSSAAGVSTVPEPSSVCVGLVCAVAPLIYLRIKRKRIH